MSASFSTGTRFELAFCQQAATTAAVRSHARHVVLVSATHNSIITGDDSPVSTRAILDVAASIRSETALR